MLCFINRVGMNQPSLLSLSEVLHQARQLLATPEQWLMEGYAADDAGRWVAVGSPCATRFTLSGALLRAARGSREHVTAARTLFDHAIRRLGLADRAANSSLSHGDALRILDLAIFASERPSRERYAGATLDDMSVSEDEPFSDSVVTKIRIRPILPQ